MQVSLIVELRGEYANDFYSIMKRVGRIPDESNGSFHISP